MVITQNLVNLKQDHLEQIYLNNDLFYRLIIIVRKYGLKFYGVIIIVRKYYLVIMHVNGSSNNKFYCKKNRIKNMIYVLNFM